MEVAYFGSMVNVHHVRGGLVVGYNLPRDRQALAAGRVGYQEARAELVVFGETYIPIDVERR